MNAEPILEDASIPGMFDFHAVYDMAVEEAPYGATLVELGIFHGKSLVYLAKKAKAANKGLQVVGVDWGLGGPGKDGTLGKPIANDVLENIHLRGLDVPLIFWDATKAARFFNQKSCFFVFIDANHEREHVEQNILAWLPKISSGGILAGHDYDCVDYPFPGVKEAVDSLLGEECGNKPIPGCWMLRPQAKGVLGFGL